MRLVENRKHLHLEIDAKDCDIPADERTRLQKFFAPLDELVEDMARAELWLTIVFHAQRQQYHTEAKLKVPGRTLFATAWESYLDSSLQKCLQRLARRAEVHKQQPDRQAEEKAAQRVALDRDVVAPEDADTGPLADAVHAGDFPRFRAGLIAYEDWLR